MVEFKTIARKSKLGEVTWPQWTTMISLVLVFQFVAFCAYSEKHTQDQTAFSNNLGNILCILCILGIAGLVISIFSNIFPITYEKLNAKIVGKLILKENKITLNNDSLRFKEIQKLEISANHFKGEHEIIIASRARLTPYYRIGKGNYINILTKDGRKFNEEFIINSKNDISIINNYLSKILIENEIGIDINKLYNLSDSVQKTEIFKDFVKKLLLEKKIDSVYGLSLLRYKTDAEAKILREKYCN